MNSTLLYQSYLSMNETTRRRILSEMRDKTLHQVHERLFAYPSMTVEEFATCYFFDKQSQEWNTKKMYDAKKRKGK